MKKLITFTMIFMLLGLFANAQVLITTTGSYYQDFNTLPSSATTLWKNDSTLIDWWSNRSGTGTNIAVTDGNTNSGNLYSFGTTASTERALGSIGSGTPKNFAWGVQFQNTSGQTLTDMTVSYIGEQWRDGGATSPAVSVAQTVNFFYKISPVQIDSTNPGVNTTWTAVPALDFTSPTYGVTTPAALDGNLAANRVVFAPYTITGLNIPDGSYIMFKWDDINHVGNDHAMGIDSLTVSWTVPTGGNTISTSAITGSPFTVTPSAGVAVNVPYTVTGTFNAGNIFTAYLSDATGSFASETAIGTLTSQTDGTISATIPQGTPSGTAYRIRVKASDPATTGTDNGTDLTVTLMIPDTTPPVASSATATSLSNITVAFNEPLQLASAETTTHYTFFGTAVTGTAILSTPNTVNLTLSTPLTSGVTDTLYVTGVNDTTGNTMALTYKFPVVFGDGTAPVALSATANSLTNVTVVFNEPLQLASAETAAHYTFFGTAVTGTAALSTPTTVNLTLSTPLTSGVTDTLYVTGVNDTTGNTMTLTYKFPVVYTTPVEIDTIVFWNFPNTPDDNIADGGITANLVKTITREPSFTDTLSYYFNGVTTKSVRAMGWDAGNGSKYWIAEFTTALYDSIRFSSVQKSSSTGPRNFRVEYSLDGTTWTIVSGTNVITANSWTTPTAKLSNISLPADCYNAASVKLRWIMTSDTAVSGTGLVAAGGASTMDDIYVTGRYNPLLGIQCQDNGQATEFSVFPNPATASVYIQLQKNADVRIDIMNITGQVVRSETRSGNQFRFDISDLSKGMYVIRLVNLADQSTSVRKLSVQ